MNIIFENSDKLLALVLMVLASLYLRALLQFAGQTWIKTVAHTATLTVLPILTYIITNVISGNIALSLGMVGALSIVRFRNPVRSPLELSVYFGAITLGISAAVSLEWMFLLVGAVTAVTATLILVNFLSQKFINKQFFTQSFSEGNNLCSLVIAAQDRIPELENSKFLMTKSASGEEVVYTLLSPSFSDLQSVEANIQSITKITSAQLSR